MIDMDYFTLFIIFAMLYILNTYCTVLLPYIYCRSYTIHFVIHFVDSWLYNTKKVLYIIISRGCSIVIVYKKSQYKTCRSYCRGVCVCHCFFGVFQCTVVSFYALALSIKHTVNTMRSTGDVAYCTVILRANNPNYNDHYEAAMNVPYARYCTV